MAEVQVAMYLDCMSAFVVRCPSCLQPSRVGADAMGMIVACPRCGGAFTAEPQSQFPVMPAPARQSEIPTVPVRSRTANRQQTPRDESLTNPALAHEPASHPLSDDHTPTGGSLILALALLPIGVPLVWLAALQLGARQPNYSFALPVAIAICFAGLCLGLGYCRWTYPRRVAGVLALVFLAYVTAGLLFTIRLDAVERQIFMAIRKALGRHVEWKPFVPRKDTLKPTDQSFEIFLPGIPREAKASPLADFPMKSFVVLVPDEFVVAYGYIGGGDDWHERVQKSIVATSGGVVKSDSELTVKGYPAWEWVIELPEKDFGPSVRVVRVVRVEKQLFYLSIEGPSITRELPQVKRFLDSFRVVKKPGG